MKDMLRVMDQSPVIPLATLPPGVNAPALAGALQAGGIHIIEIALRTDAALPSIEAIRNAWPDMCVGAGTVWTPEQARSAIEAGAEFIVSPGGVDEVYEVCEELGVAYLPGVQTVTEAGYWSRVGLNALKFFPAGAAGGPSALKAIAAVLPGVQWCPTGCFNLKNAREYLALANVPCVGGSWLLEKQALAQGDWAQVESLAAQACELRLRMSA